MKTADPKAAAARAFVRSLNILLKFARLYGYDHARTAEQLKVAWEELREAIPEGAESGLLLGATGSQLLLDGVPLEGAPAEKQFAQLLSMAGLASIWYGNGANGLVVPDSWKQLTGDTFGDGISYVLLVAVLYMALALLADVLYTLLNPRVRLAA